MATTVSVRVEKELLHRLDTVTTIIPISKSDFLRTCLEKLCDDNQILVDHSHRAEEYIAYIKDELSKLPENIVLVKNGTLTEVKESTILILCDELWRFSEPVYNAWLKLLKEYDIETAITDFAKAEQSQGVLDIGDIAMLLVEKKGSIERPDIRILVEEQYWGEQMEIQRVSLSYACKKAFEEKSSRVIIHDYLEKEKKRKKERRQRLVIDAKGTCTRRGSLLYLPVHTEEIQKDE